MTESIIKVQNLTKKFKDLTAVNNISFNVNDRDIFAFLGPNGAGKSTVIKMLITLLKPTSGTAFVGGYNIAREAAKVRAVIGYVPQLISVDSTLTAYENLDLMAQLYDIPRRERRQGINETLAFLGVEELSHSLVRTFSGGTVRKIEIGQAIMHHPKVLFLDEPTSGLDPIARHNVWEILTNLNKQYDTTIFFSTHYLEEAETYSNQVAIMNLGEIAAIGTAKELKAKTGPDASLEDAFIHFTGSAMEASSGNFHDVRRSRATQRRLG
ncbi:MAG: ATP-binding cassette domain-containing protein [Patescibacteria group bacterium]|nr:ATP-binding cassette domain-containing protein [Patescibacteria group bacterium]